MKKIKAIILCSESSGGKNKLFERLIAETELIPTVSHTTRKPRLGEVEGKDYYFINNVEFYMMLANNEFIETRNYNSKHEGLIMYGLAKSEVDLTNDKTYLIIVDLEGLDEVKQYVPNAYSIYLETSPVTRICRSLERQRVQLEREYFEGKNTILTEIFNRVERDREDFKDVNSRVSIVLRNETEDDLENNITYIKNLIGQKENI